MNNPSSDDSEHRILPFRTRGGGPSAQPRREPPIEDLARFEHGEESPAEYRNRMIVNIAGLAFVVALVAAAIWLTDTMATMRKNQDCVLSGRTGCSPVDYTVRQR
jgi:hypothetical protein